MRFGVDAIFSSRQPHKTFNAFSHSHSLNIVALKALMAHSPRSRSPSYAHVGGPAPSSRRRSGLRSKTTQLMALRFGWVVLVIWCEVGEFFHSVSPCRFPDALLRQLNPSPAATTHVLLISDPHIPFPVPFAGTTWRSWARRTLSELYMRKAWDVVMRLGRVDAVLFTGDMLDWGRGNMEAEDYSTYVDKFHSIFRIPSSASVHYVPGNHDYGLGRHDFFSPYARQRYSDAFSPPNTVVPIANHSFILLDSVGLVEEDYMRYSDEMQFGEWEGVDGGVIDFIKDLGTVKATMPRILVSHIPLARPEASTCGPLREKGRILKGAGPGYQNLLGSETSRFLLNVLGPTIVFSGDDHDYCEYTHPSGIREVTLKSFSPDVGIRQPGFQLLSLLPSTADIDAFPQPSTHADMPCLLPDPWSIYKGLYLPLAIFTILWLFITNARAAFFRMGWGKADKVRGSPAMFESGTFGQPTSSLSSARRQERPVPLTLPSRKSSQHLPGMVTTPSTTPRARPQPLTPSRRSSRSVPVSAQSSPRGSIVPNDDEAYEREDYQGGSLSRKSSTGSLWQQENDYLAPVSQEPSSYFLPLPQQEGTGLGLGLGPQPGSPAHRIARRVSNSSLANHPSMAQRYTAPRLPSDWQSASKAKDTTVLGLMFETASKQGWRRWLSFETIWRAWRWFWAGAWRHGVLAKSWRETLAVAWPAAIVWIGINAMYFWER